MESLSTVDALYLLTSLAGKESFIKAYELIYRQELFVFEILSLNTEKSTGTWPNVLKIL